MAFVGIGDPAGGVMVGIDAAGLIVPGVVFPRGRYARAPNFDPDAAVADGVAPNLAWQKGDFRAAGPGIPAAQVALNDRALRRDRANFDRIVIVAAQAAPNDELLAGCIGAFAIAAADSGRLVTADPGPNTHGLPTNFGRGRGRWRESDVPNIRTRIRLTEQELCQVSSPPDGDVVAGDLFRITFVDNDLVTPTGVGNLVLDYKSQGLLEIGPGASIEIDYVHTVQR